MQKPQDSFVVSIIKEPQKEMTVGELIIGSLGIVGSLLVLALVFGAVAGAAMVIWNRYRPAASRHLPSVSPSVTDVPPNSQSR